MIEMRWKRVVTRYHLPVSHNAVELHAGGLPFVLQYRVVLEFDTEHGPATGKGEWQDVPIDDAED